MKNHHRFLTSLCFLVSVLLLLYTWFLHEGRTTNDVEKDVFSSDDVIMAPPAIAIATVFTILRDDIPNDNDWEDMMNSRSIYNSQLLASVNAVRSWLTLGLDVILFGNDAMCWFFMHPRLSSSFNATIVCLPIPCIHTSLKVPLYSCLFERAALHAHTSIIMYANSDIVFRNDLLDTLVHVRKRFPRRFLAIGRRRDVEYSQFIHSFAANGIFMQHVEQTGHLHGPMGIDYFIFPHASVPKLPPFLVGRILWDNWLVATHVKDEDCNVVDVTNGITAVHLSHGVLGDSHFRPGTDINRRLFNESGVPVLMGVDEADFVMSKDRIILPNTLQRYDVTLYKVAINNTVLLTSVSAPYLDQALDWYCSLAQVGVRRVLFHALDDVTHQALLSRGLPSTTFTHWSDGVDSNPKGVRSGISRWCEEITVSLATVLLRLIDKGYSVLYTRVNSHFRGDPFRIVHYSNDIMVDDTIDGRALWLRASVNARAFWINILRALKTQLHRNELIAHSKGAAYRLIMDNIRASMIFHRNSNTLVWGIFNKSLLSFAPSSSNSSAILIFSRDSVDQRKTNNANDNNYHVC